MPSWPEAEVAFSALVYGGDALGRLPDGRAVFTPYVLAGERARVRLTEDKPRYARAVLGEVLTPDAARIEPRCIHYGECGGCHYQHMAYPAQLEAKRLILIDQLERIGKLGRFDLENLVAPTVGSAPWNYRNYIQFHLTPQGELGFVSASGERVIPIRECHLPQDTLNRVWPQLEVEAIPGLERVGLRMGEDDDLQITLESSSPETPELSVEDLDVSVVHLLGDHPIVLAGSEYVVMRVLERDFRLSAGSFFQVNTPMAEAMVSYLIENLPLGDGETVLDVYCGVGLFSAFLAERAAHLTGIEASPLACDDFVANLDEFDHVDLFEGAAEEILPALDLKADVVLVDPPRAGLARDVLDAIVALRPHRLAYVSCDPATLARDARRLVEHGFRPESMRPFDLFPQTYHIESISIWTPGG